MPVAVLRCVFARPFRVPAAATGPGLPALAPVPPRRWAWPPWSRRGRSRSSIGAAAGASA